MSSRPATKPGMVKLVHADDGITRAFWLHGQRRTINPGASFEATEEEAQRLLAEGHVTRLEQPAKGGEA